MSKRSIQEIDQSQDIHQVVVRRRTSEPEHLNQFGIPVVERIPAQSIRIGLWTKFHTSSCEIWAEFNYGSQGMTWEITEFGSRSKIKILWSNVLAITCFNVPNGCGFAIELGRPPTFSFESLWRPLMDSADIQAHRCRRHYLQFLPGVLDRCYQMLLQCSNHLRSCSLNPFPSLETPYFFTETDNLIRRDMHGNANQFRAIDPSLRIQSTTQVQSNQQAAIPYLSTTVSPVIQAPGFIGYQHFHGSSAFPLRATQMNQQVAHHPQDYQMRPSSNGSIPNNISNLLLSNPPAQSTSEHAQIYLSSAFEFAYISPYEQSRKQVFSYDQTSTDRFLYISPDHVPDLNSLPILNTHVPLDEQSDQQMSSHVQPSADTEHLNENEMASQGGSPHARIPASSIRIGEWEGTSTIWVEFDYGSQSMAWEFWKDEQKAKIQMKWSDVLAISGFNTETGYAILQIELGNPPGFLCETQNVWQPWGDFTEGEASVHRRHYLMFLPGVLDSHYEMLLQWSAHMRSCSQKPFPSLQDPYFNSSAGNTS